MEENQTMDGRGGAARPGDRGSRRRDAVRRTVADPAEVARLFSALPPSAPEAEMSLLGAMLVDPKVIPDVIGIVSDPDDFARAGHGTIFRHMVALYDSTATLEIVSLVQRLKDHGVLEDVGGSDYLVDLAEGVASAANAAEYARLVREKATLRELIRAAGEILVDAHQSRQDPVLTLGEAEARIFAIAQRREARMVARLQDLLQEAVIALESNAGKHVTGVPTGFDELDEMLSGLQRGEMVILAARPSMGKTALALNMCEYAALKTGRAAAVFSMEMSASQLAFRLISSLGRVNAQNLRTGELEDEDWSRVSHAITLLADAKIFIDDTPALSPTELRSRARRLAREHGGLALIVIDYLQLMQVPGNKENRATEIAEISRSLKALAKELNCPVIALSQLNRSLEQRTDKRPVMADLRESGAIEQDADVIVFIYRDEYYNPESADKGLAEIIIGKQRNGPTGTVKLAFLGQYTRFENFAGETYAGGFE